MGKESADADIPCCFLPGTVAVLNTAYYQVTYMAAGLGLVIVTVDISTSVRK
jgi:hypothetical protein